VQLIWRMARVSLPAGIIWSWPDEQVVSAWKFLPRCLNVKRSHHFYLSPAPLPKPVSLKSPACFTDEITTQ
jgi:hypothetical protein